MVPGAFAVAGAACWFDVRTRRIPNWLTFSAAAAGLLLSRSLMEGRAPSRVPRGLVVGLALFPALRSERSWRWSVKLMGALGAWLGTSVVFGCRFLHDSRRRSIALGLMVALWLCAPGGAEPLAAAHVIGVSLASSRSTH